MRVGKEVSFMPEGKTIGQLMEEMRQKAGAQNYHGHDYMDLQRFAENTRHMIIFDVLTHDSRWAGKVNEPACFCQIRAMKKLWTVRQRDRSRFSVMQRSEMEICSMTVLSKFVEGGSMKKYLLRRLVVPP